MKQTAVEWLFLMMNNPNKDQEFANRLLDKAKEIEKEQITNAWLHGKLMHNSRIDYHEEYYNKTYKG